MQNQKGLGLIGILLIIGALIILTAGGVVAWQRKVAPTTILSPTPTPAPTPATPPSPETSKVPPENPPKIEDLSQFCGLEGLKKLSRRQFPVIWIDKCGSLYRLFRECCDAPDIILDENFNFVAECGGVGGYSDECKKLVFPHSNECARVVKCKL